MLIEMIKCVLTLLFPCVKYVRDVLKAVTMRTQTTHGNEFVFNCAMRFLILAFFVWVENRHMGFLLHVL